MSTNRISGPTPSEPGKPDGKSVGEGMRSKATERVEKVEEVDPDAQSKANKFRNALKDAEDQLNNALESPQDRSPSPFETSFYTTTEEKKPALGGSRQGPLPEPPTTPPPDVSAQTPAPSPSEEDLPDSDDFWSNVDEFSEPLPPAKQLQETPQSATRKEAAKKGELPGAPHKKEFASPEKPVKSEKGKFAAKKEEGPFPPGEKPIVEKSKPSPFEAPVKKEIPKEKPVPAAPFGRREEKGEEKAFVPSKPPPSKEQKIAQMHTAARREKEQGEKEREKRPIEIEGPSLPPLPPEIIPIAQAATTQAAPYLSPQILPLFFQMVGTISVLAREAGVSRTEILLNAPSFANSRFFGSTILIEKYATAPDSLNIRLSGSDEAVTLFNQNIPSLMAAFQNGNFSFRINRIDTAYSSERPLFRRKEPGRESGGSGGLGG